MSKAIENSEYTHIWHVLRALIDQDTELSDMVKTISRQSGGSATRVPFDDHYIYVSTSNAKLSKLINVKILDNIGDKWEKWYGQLVAYQQLTGTTIVEEGDIKNIALHRWIVSQRVFRRKNLVPQSRIDKLDAIGFEWDPLESAWQNMFMRLKQYFEKHKTNKIAKYKNDEELTKLYKWTEMQRRLYHGARDAGRGSNYEMLEHRKNLLLTIGFDFGKDYKSSKEIWPQRFAELVEYCKTHNKNINLHDLDPNKLLVQWVQKQRSNFLANKLSDEKIKLLQDAGVILDTFGHAWDVKYEEYLSQRKSGKISSNIAGWVVANRTKFKQNKLKPSQHERFAALIKDGLRLHKLDEVLSEQGKKYIKMLVSFYKKHGHFNVTYINDKNLYNWATKARLQHKRRTIKPFLQEALDEIGFDWEGGADFQFEKWMATFKEYKKYHKRFHTEPVCYDGIPKKIINFRNSSRVAKRANKLEERRMKLLNDLSFDWGKND